MATYHEKKVPNRSQGNERKSLEDHRQITEEMRFVLSWCHEILTEDLLMKVCA